MKKLTLITAMIFAIGTLTAQIIHVPADQPTIQAGIDAALDGDTVLVAEDTYLENINFDGKAITLASNFIMDGDTSHISNTIIDGSQPDNPDLGSVVTFDSGEDTTSVLCGFTITGGTGTDVPAFNSRAGGGIICLFTGAKIINNYITNNTINNTSGSGYGAGMLCDHLDASWTVIDGNIITNNSINSVNEALGGGIAVFGRARIENNEVTDNLASSLAGISGGGISCKGTFNDPSFKELLLTNNLIDNNTANSQSSTTEGAYFGGLYVEGYYGTVRNNTIINNSVSAYDGQLCYAPGFMSIRNPDNIIVENNIIQGNYFTNGECWGGGICVWMGGGVYQNNNIQNNKAYDGGGMFIYSFETGEIPNIINNTITENDATHLGGGLYIYSSEVVVLNTVLWGNTASSEISSINEEESNLEVRNSNVEGGWLGNGNIDVDPQFRSDGYHLDYPSELVNAGVSTLLINGEWYDAPEYDIDGDERPFESTEPDIGADEALWYYVGVDEHSKTDLDVTVYPNPASSDVHFSISASNNIISGSNKITLFKTDGRMVYESVIIESNFAINISHLPSGVYYAKLNLGELMINKKIVINR